VGANNLELLQPRGQFGSRLQGGADSASPRYIYTLLSDAARLLFCKDDDGVLAYLEDDGTRIEPEHYLPVIPMLLVNGATGIGTGFSTSVPCHNPRDVIDRVRRLVAADEDADPLDVPLGPPLRPWYRGFKGAIVQLASGKLVSRGVVSRVSGAGCKLRVTELPLGTWTEDFKEALEGFVERNSDVRGFENASTDTIVDMTVTFASKDALESWSVPCDAGEGVSRFEAELRLSSPKGLGVTNMHAFDARGVIRKYDSPEDVLRDHFRARLYGYVRRKARILDALRRDVLVLEQKVAFVGHVVGGALELHRRDSGEDLDAEMGRLGLVPAVDGAFRFLTSMAMASMTRDKMLSLQRELDSTRGAVDALEATTPRQLWTRDLDALEAALPPGMYAAPL
jgi:DNA topoisomerase-2